eukprot:CAMPEP_0175953706 /NCGR_PEP_ID=MMETSP0108-20121206/31505_1 /TAXON_ID=195067 ORGANISM="Goniomonas pacifica, Strain CCMP1869" /NCGR_SAMPLE_ID=MMETSP0108 /ASSEMBLY_ACC=CAM_ASM_000204 /LENGTH=412 /DNA_ID=CAMNT_0017280307 /DNA_START=44 /DNA_END=1282 /DNA_ORIENTATION=-
MAEPEEGEAGAPQPGPAAAIVPSSEEIVEKLKFLDYEKHFCLTTGHKPVLKMYFSQAAANPNEQFYFFSSIVAWLFGILKVSFQQPGQFDDPNAIASNILDGLRRASLPADYPPAKVKQAHGDVACAVLTSLLDRCLAANGFQIQRPVYLPDEYEDEAPVDEDEDLDQEIQDDMVAAEDSDEELFHVGGAAASTSADKEELSKTMAVEPTRDPAQWQLELERVAPLLKVRAQPDDKEWRTHVEMTHQLHTGINERIPDTRKQLERIEHAISQALDSICTREKYINNQYDGLVDEYRRTKEMLADVSRRHQESSDAVAERTNELARISDELESIKGEMDERGKNMEETGPLVRLKDSMKKLRREIREMELRIGTVAHSLLDVQLKKRQGLSDFEREEENMLGDRPGSPNDDDI